MEYRKILQWLLYLVALLTANPLMAQVEEDEEEDGTDSTTVVVTETLDSAKKVKTIQIRIGNDKPITIRRSKVKWDEYETVLVDSSWKGKPKRELKKVETDWFTLDIGLNTFVHNGSFSLPPSLSGLELDPIKSAHVKVGIVKQRVNLVNHKFNLIYGIEYDNNDYRFQENIDFKKNDSLGNISYDKLDPKTPGFVRNKLTTRFLTLPVSFRYESNPRRTGRSFRVEAGGQVGFRLTSFFKTVWEVDDEKYKKKQKDDFYLNNFRYGAFVKVGYGEFTLFANYIFTPLFRDNTGPELNTFSVGVCLWEDMF